VNKNTSEEQRRNALSRDKELLQNQLLTMRANKLLIVQTTADTIQSLRDNVKQLSSKLRVYEERK